MILILLEVVGALRGGGVNYGLSINQQTTWTRFKPWTMCFKQLTDSFMTNKLNPLNLAFFCHWGRSGRFRVFARTTFAAARFDSWAKTTRSLHVFARDANCQLPTANCQHSIHWRIANIRYVPRRLYTWTSDTRRGQTGWPTWHLPDAAKSSSGNPGLTLFHIELTSNYSIAHYEYIASAKMTPVLKLY